MLKYKNLPQHDEFIIEFPVSFTPLCTTNKITHGVPFGSLDYRLYVQIVYRHKSFICKYLNVYLQGIHMLYMYLEAYVVRVLGGICCMCTWGHMF